MWKRQMLAVLVTVTLLATASAEDRRLDSSQLTVMTFNTLFMWDGVEPEEGNVQFPWKGSQTEAEDHMRDIAQVIIQNNPDIVNLVEIENLNALNTLNNKFLTGRGYRAYFVQGKDSQTGQDLGVLSRIDPEGGAIARDDRSGRSGSVTKSVSKNYYGKFVVNGKKIALVGLHFLARPNAEDRRPQREAQADVIAQVAMELANQGYAVIVLGDFNDFDGDVPDHISSQPISKVLRIVKRMKPDDTTDDLFSVAEMIPQARRYTSFWDQNENETVDHPREHSSIDHILVSPSLRSTVESVDIPHNHDPRKVSDHYPVVLRLRLDGGVSQPQPTPAPPPSLPGRIVIVRMLPNPEGDENINEEVTIRNVGTGDVNLTGWLLRDLAKRTWTLDSLGGLKQGEVKTIKRNGQPMSLNNGGDTIEVISPSGSVVDSLTYGKVEEGEEVRR